MWREENKCKKKYDILFIKFQKAEVDNMLFGYTYMSDNPENQ